MFLSGENIVSMFATSKSLSVSGVCSVQEKFFKIYRNARARVRDSRRSVC